MIVNEHILILSIILCSAIIYLNYSSYTVYYRINHSTVKQLRVNMVDSLTHFSSILHLQSTYWDSPENYQCIVSNSSLKNYPVGNIVDAYVYTKTGSNYVKVYLVEHTSTIEELRKNYKSSLILTIICLITLVLQCTLYYVG